MADSKISALPASTTPLAGTEVLPIVQSSATRQVSVANLTAGRAISATQLTLTTGNLIVASGQGIDFSATSGSGTSELLADYEEGTWTAGFTGWTIDPTSTSAQYTKIGRTVTITMLGLGGTTTTGSISGLPFTSNSSQGATAVIRGASSNINAVGAIIDSSALISNIGTMTAGGNYWTLSATYIV